MIYSRIFRRLLGRIFHRFPSEFRDNRSGNFAIPFAIGMSILIIASGMAIDMVNLTSQVRHAQNAADVAAIHGAMLDDSEVRKLKSKTRKLFIENLGAEANNYKISKFNSKRLENGVTHVEVHGKGKPLFMQIMGYPRLSFSVDSQAIGGNGPARAEMAILLDATQSMGFSGSRDFVEVELKRGLELLFAGGDTNPNLYLSFLPYTDRVNVGSSRTHFLSSPVPAGWQGCTEPRYQPAGPFPFRLTDAPPSAGGFQGTPTNYWPPYFIELWFPIHCPSESVVATHSKTEVNQALDNYVTASTGRPDMALAWGWRLLSPRWRGQWGVPDYPADYGEVPKYLIFITDGYSRLYCEESNSFYPNRPPELDGEAVCKNEVSNESFRHMVDMCERIKAEGIELNIMYLNGIARGTSFMRDCASPGRFYDINNMSEISWSVNDIFNGLSSSEVRLVE